MRARSQLTQGLATRQRNCPTTMCRIAQPANNQQADVYVASFLTSGHARFFLIVATDISSPSSAHPLLSAHDLERISTRPSRCYPYPYPEPHLQHNTHHLWVATPGCWSGSQIKSITTRQAARNSLVCHLHFNTRHKTSTPSCRHLRHIQTPPWLYIRATKHHAHHLSQCHPHSRWGAGYTLLRHEVLGLTAHHEPQ